MVEFDHIIYNIINKINIYYFAEPKGYPILRQKKKLASLKRKKRNRLGRRAASKFQYRVTYSRS
jgi:hypothetical protein